MDRLSLGVTTQPNVRESAMSQSWTVYVENGGVSQGRLDYEFATEPRVGQKIRFDLPPIADQPTGWYLITSVNVHSHIAVIEPTIE